MKILAIVLRLSAFSSRLFNCLFDLSMSLQLVHQNKTGAPHFCRHSCFSHLTHPFSLPLTLDIRFYHFQLLQLRHRQRRRHFPRLDLLHHQQCCLLCFRSCRETFRTHDGRNMRLMDNLSIMLVDIVTITGGRILKNLCHQFGRIRSCFHATA